MLNKQFRKPQTKHKTPKPQSQTQNQKTKSKTIDGSSRGGRGKQSIDFLHYWAQIARQKRNEPKVHPCLTPSSLERGKQNVPSSDLVQRLLDCPQRQQSQGNKKGKCSWTSWNIIFRRIVLKALTKSRRSRTQFGCCFNASLVICVIDSRPLYITVGTALKRKNPQSATALISKKCITLRIQ